MTVAAKWATHDALGPLATNGGEMHAGVGLSQGNDTMAPDLLDAEVFHRLVRAEQGGALQRTQLDERLALLSDAPIERVPCRELLTAARRFATALSGYDALYAALAGSLQCPLVTTDGRVSRTAATQFGLTVTHVPTSGR